MDLSSFVDKVRLGGAREHLQRVRFFADLASKQTDAAAAFRLRLAALYSCRAMTELMLEAAEQGEVQALKATTNPKERRAALEDLIRPRVPFYALIERIRIHDFHRFGVVPPDPSMKQMMLGGPMRLTASKGTVGVALTDKGAEVVRTGASSVQFMRPLLIQDGRFFDNDTLEFVDSEQILNAFLEKGADLLGKFADHVA